MKSIFRNFQTGKATSFSFHDECHKKIVKNIESSGNTVVSFDEAYKGVCGRCLQQMKKIHGGNK